MNSILETKTIYLVVKRHSRHLVLAADTLDRAIKLSTKYEGECAQILANKYEGHQIIPTMLYYQPSEN